MFLITIGVLILGLLCYYLNIKEYIRYRKWIYYIPGPRQIPILGHIDILLLDDEARFKILRKWSREHYPAYHLALAMVASVNISGAEDFEAIASTTKNIKKSLAYVFLNRWLGEGLLTSDGLKWQQRRKILTPAFHFSILQQFVSIFNNETHRLVEALKKECGKEYVNVVPFISESTLHAINETSMGIKLDFVNAKHKEYYSAIHEISKIMVYRFQRPWLYIQPIFYNLSPEGYKELKLVRILHEFTNNIIAKKSETFTKIEMQSEEEINYSKGKKLAMLDLLLNSKLNGTIDDKGIQDEVNTFMFEGHDTTSMSICFTLMLLACHRDVQDLILQELEEILGDSKFPPTYNQLQEMKYMERCIKESLRLYPSVPFIARILEEDIMSSTGYLLPKGLTANIHIFDIHRDPKVWPDPEKFDPDRFLPENCQNRHPFSYVPFSAGPRNCIGQRYAILEIKSVVCGILRNFILEPVDTPETLVLVQDIILRTHKDIVRVKFTPREKC